MASRCRIHLRSESAAMSASPAARIESLDQFCGYAEVGMPVVNFGSAVAAVRAVSRHHDTNCSYADTIWPHSFFAVGLAPRFVLLRNIAAMCAPTACGRSLRRIGLFILPGVAYYNRDGKWIGARGWGDLQLRL
jgi:predicted acyltransferase